MSDHEQEPEGPDDLDLSEIEGEDGLLDSDDEDTDDRLLPAEAPDE